MLSSHVIKLELAALVFAVVKYFDYIVENDCITGSNEDFSANSVLNIALDMAAQNLLGNEVLRLENVQSQLNISSLKPRVYFVNMTQGSRVSTKKLLAN